MKHADIVGKTLTFTYTNDTYRIEVTSETKLRWTQLRGDNPGSGDDEDYVFNELAGGLALITWIEADGLGLSNVLDPATGTLTTHANMGREVFQNLGAFALSP